MPGRWDGTAASIRDWVAGAGGVGRWPAAVLPVVGAGRWPGAAGQPGGDHAQLSPASRRPGDTPVRQVIPRRYPASERREYQRFAGGGGGGLDEPVPRVQPPARRVGEQVHVGAGGAMVRVRSSSAAKTASPMPRRCCAGSKAMSTTWKYQPPSPSRRPIPTTSPVPRCGTWQMAQLPRGAGAACSGVRGVRPDSRLAVGSPRGTERPSRVRSRADHVNDCPPGPSPDQAVPQGEPSHAGESSAGTVHRRLRCTRYQLPARSVSAGCKVLRGCVGVHRR